MSFLRVVLFTILTFTLIVPALSQQPAQKPKKSSKSQPALSKEAEELRLSATSILQSLVQGANEIENINDRVRVLAEIGDAFWLVDKEQARTVLIRAFKEIDKLHPEAPGDPDELASQKRMLRRVVLSRVAKHEPSLASQLLHDLPGEVPTADETAMQRQGIPTPNAEALLGVADGLIATDPKRAATMASYSLQDGLSQRLRHFLIKLRAKDSGTSDALVAAAVKEASAQHPGRLFDVMVLWDYVYQPQDFYFNGIVWDRETRDPRQNTSAELKRLVLAFAVNAIVENLQQLSASPGESTQERNLANMHLGSLHSVIQQLLPSMQADWPRGTADLQQALVRVEQELKTAGQGVPSRPPVNDSDSDSTGVDSLLEKAAAASQGELRDSLYLAAAIKLFELRQYERGNEVASKIDDMEKRAMILEPLNFRLAGELVEKSKLQEALGVANQLKTPELRISSLARIGRAFSEAGDTATASQTLNMAQAMAGKADPALELSAATLRIAAALPKDDAIRVTEVISLAIQILNKAKQDDTLWAVLSPRGPDDALSFSARFGEGGGVKAFKVNYPRNGGLTDLLSRVDFNQAISLAKTINRKTLSLAAQAAVCRAALESTAVKTVTAGVSEGSL